MTSFADVDLTNCDREPIHLLGAIQPNGFPLALRINWNVARASRNVAFAALRGLMTDSLWRTYRCDLSQWLF